jgi:hypothetical protein
MVAWQWMSGLSCKTNKREKMGVVGSTEGNL